MIKHTPFLALLALLTGCASQPMQEQILSQQNAQARVLEQQQVLLASQQQTLIQLVEQQGHLQESLEVSEQQLQTLVNHAKRKPKPQSQPAPRKQDMPTALTVAATKDVPAPQKLVLGRVEFVWVKKLQGYLKARVDTGAKSSSIHATNIQYFERDGAKWVRFNMHTHKKIAQKNNVKGSQTNMPLFEAPLVRTVKIKQASAAKLDERPVIKLRLRMGTYEDDAEFTLADRSNMLYPLLIGRSFLKDVAVVDVGQVFIHKRQNVGQAKSANHTKNMRAQ